MRPRLGLLDAFDWLAARYLERTERAARELPPILYLSLALLALLQAVNPGAIERIAAQSVGRWLLAGVTALLFVAAVLAVTDLALHRARTLLGPGGLDALLHFSLATVGLELSFGRQLLPAALGSVVIGGLGLSCAGAGSYVAAAALLHWRSDHDVSSLRSGLVLRDHLVRGGVPMVLGSLLFASSVQNLPGLGLDPSRQVWAIPLLVAATLALFVYGLHGIWSMRQEARLAMY